jgi:hypothetical protein
MGIGKETVQTMYQRSESQAHSMYHFVFSNFITVHPYILITNTDITHSHDKYIFINTNSIIRFRILRAIQNTVLSIHYVL